jgi:hypothetical protein
MSKRCVVVFPLYQAPTALELSFLENGLKRTEGHKQVIVAPEDLKIDHQFGQLQQLEVKRFAGRYFKDISGYNQLLLSKTFYSAFALFDYILIHQADVYLFKDELGLWCEKGYDYIGAPWFRPDQLGTDNFSRLWKKTKLIFKKNKLYGSRYNKVGNGGLSLRKVKSAMDVLSRTPPHLLKKYMNSDGKEFNEDIFWSLEAPLIQPNFKIPSLKTALNFAVEFQPKEAFEYINRKLPFGCHAPLVHDRDFWKEYIPALQHVEPY